MKTCTIPTEAVDALQEVFTRSTGQNAVVLYRVLAQIKHQPEPDERISARALVEAGYMPLDEYMRLCRDRGWVAGDQQKDEP